MRWGRKHKINSIMKKRVTSNWEKVSAVVKHFLRQFVILFKLAKKFRNRRSESADD